MIYIYSLGRAARYYGERIALAFGGSPMPVELFRRTRRLLPGVKLVDLYGTAETGFLTALEAPEDIVGRFSCGQPCPGIDIEVFDPSSGEPVAAGQSGEIVARGANVMLGYWNHPECTARAFRNNFLRTRRPRLPGWRWGLFIVDRLADMIITGGEKVYCGEVEAVIYQIPVVREAAVFGIPDPRRGDCRSVCCFATGRISFRAGTDPSLPAIVTVLQDSTARRVSEDGLTEDCRRQCVEADASRAFSVW